MPVLKYWNSKEWVQVSGMDPDHQVLRKIGGKMTGTLHIGGKLATTGHIQAGYITGHPAHESKLDMNISLLARSVNFGGSVLNNISNPVEDDDAATHGYMKNTSTSTLKEQPLTPGNSWKNYDTSFGDLEAQISGDGMISINGAMETTTPIEPGNSSAPITILPEELRPTTRKVFPVAGHTLIRIDVFPSGEVRVIAAPSPMGTGFRVALNDICFYPR